MIDFGIRVLGWLALLIGLGSASGWAATIVVNDASDVLHSPGCATTGTGACSLRDAITFANSNAGADSIQFSIPGPGVHRMMLGSSLPAISDPSGGITLDGYTQPGASPNTLSRGENARILIEIDGSLVPPGGCLYITSPSNRIQGVAIHGCPEAQIWITGGANNVVTGNFVGTDPTGMSGVSSGGDGVLIMQGAAGNRLGGSLPNERNLISGNRALGVEITFGSEGNVVEGNYVGLAADGVTALPNNRGVGVFNGAAGNSIGGENPRQGNVISGNSNQGLSIARSSSNLVQGNLVGTDLSGRMAVPNRTYGIVVFDGSANVIGGMSAGAANVISGNAAGGFLLADFSNETSGAVVQGNRIGTDVTGVIAIPNMGFGVWVFGHVTTSQIGGTGPGTGNVIAYNAGPGIEMTGSDTGLPIGIAVRGNTIYGNAALGIDLGDDGVTPNDPCDVDSGPNNLQNFPVLASAVAELGGVTIRAALNSAPTTTFTIDFYSNDICDPSGYGQGQTFLGSRIMSTDSNCDGSFTANLPVVIPLRSWVTATATDPFGNTSEFSACIPLAAQYYTVVPTLSGKAASLLAFLLALSGLVVLRQRLR